jgi:hypothetical protein
VVQAVDPFDDSRAGAVSEVSLLGDVLGDVAGKGLAGGHAADVDDGSVAHGLGPDVCDFLLRPELPIGDDVKVWVPRL